MFTTKQSKLFEVPSKNISVSGSSAGKGSVVPVFVQQGLHKAVACKSGNGSEKLSSTLDPFVDQFGTLGNFKAPRSFDVIQKDCEILWASDKLNTVKFGLYIRTIPRKVVLFDGSSTEEPQLGAELKHEAIMRMIWLSQKAPGTFWKNIGLFVSLGSWHDIFTMLQYDLIFNGWDGRKLDWNKFGNLIISGLSNSATSELVKKYLPHIRAKSVCTTVESQANTLIGKWICSLIYGAKDSSANYQQYRKLKSSGTAHQWQQLISRQKYDQIDFGKIHGRALHLLVKGKFLKNHGLQDKYDAWIAKPETAVKFTGFVHEIFHGITTSIGSQAMTADKQFATLVEKARTERKENATNFIVVRDTSGSMGSAAKGTKSTCFDIAKSLALYFSEFLTGPFANSFIEFNDQAKMHLWKGNTPTEKFCNDRCNCVGSTNFQGVIDLFCRLKREGMDEKDFPTGILCISDGEFNPSQLGQTNVQTARRKLVNAGFSQVYAEAFQIVLWNLQSNAYGPSTGSKFETTASEAGCCYMSGYSASAVAFITGSEIKTARDVFDAAMDQSILNRVEL